MFSCKLRIFTKFRSLLSNAPRRRILHLANFTLATTLVIILLKCLIYFHEIPLRHPRRSSSRETEIASFPSNRLLNLNDFYYESNNETLCTLDENTKKLLVIIVSSARDHFSERKAIRDTYGSLSSIKDWSIRVAFLLGSLESQPTPSKPFKANAKLEISKEIQTHGDIIMGNFVDSYRNLTYKHTMGYKWILEYCSHAAFVWKLDDDIFLDPFTVTQWHDNELSSDAVGNERNQRLTDFYCVVQAGTEPQRDKTLKWYVSHELWPYPRYPNYCGGLVYGVSVNWIRNIYKESLSAKHILWIDDLFVTGILVDNVVRNTKAHPRIKDIWKHVTYNYDPLRTTFCLQKNGVPKSQRKFEAFGRFLRGETLEREMRCVWDNLVTGSWKPIQFNE